MARASAGLPSIFERSSWAAWMIWTTWVRPMRPAHQPKLRTTIVAPERRSVSRSNISVPKFRRGRCRVGGEVHGNVRYLVRSSQDDPIRRAGPPAELAADTALYIGPYI